MWKPKSNKPPAKRSVLFDEKPLLPWLEIKRRPFVSYGLIAVNIIVFVAFLISTKSWGINSSGTVDFIEWGGNWAPLTLDNQSWRLVTSCFLHLNILHILMNMFSLIITGRLCEKFYGHLKTAIIYCISGVGSGVFSILVGLIGSAAGFSSSMLPVSVGASGAICGLIGAYAAALFTHRNDFEPGVYRLTAKEFFFFLIGLLFYGIFLHLDQGAHFGGLLIGFGLGLGLLPHENRHAFERRDYLAIAITSIAVLALFLILKIAPIDKQGNFIICRAHYLAAKQKFDEGEALIKGLIAEQPQNREAKLALADIYLEGDTAEKSIPILTEVLREGKPAASEYIRLALANLRARHFSECIAACDAALKLDPADQAAASTRSWALIEKGWAAGNFADVMKYSKQFYDAASDAKDKGYRALIYTLAARRCNAASADSLIKNCQYYGLKDWISSLVQFMAGKIDKTKILSLAQSNDEKTEAMTYVGLCEIQKHEIASAKAHLEWVMKHGNKTFFEYDFARDELARMK
jgi:membrane associated rhomboid family serine protease